MTICYPPEHREVRKCRYLDRLPRVFATVPAERTARESSAAVLWWSASSSRDARRRKEGRRFENTPDNLPLSRLDPERLPLICLPEVDRLALIEDEPLWLPREGGSTLSKSGNMLESAGDSSGLG